MKRNLPLWQFTGFVLSTLGGTLLHFLYDLSRQSVAAAPVSAVNESTWEHMKLLFVPLFLFTCIQSRFFKNHPSFWCAKLIGIVVGLVAIPVIFYTYNGAFGPSPDWFNITIYFIAAAIAFLLEYHLLSRNNPCRHSSLCASLLVLIGILFIVWTFSPPDLPLFVDPLTGTVGIAK